MSGTVECTFLTSLTSADGAEAGHVPDLPRIVFAGRSNVGKSSLINSLVGSKKLARTSSIPGRTRAVNLFNINKRWVFADLPGYGYARVPQGIRSGWKTLIEGFLRSDGRIELAILIVDSRRDPGPLDRVMQDFLNAYQIQTQVVATKIDRVRSSRRGRSLQQIERSMGIDGLVAYSSRTGEGKKALWRIIKEV